MTEAEPGDRGSLTIAPAVLRKLVEQVAGEVPGTLRTRRRGARITVSGNDLDVRLDVALRYPVPVRPTVDTMRVTVGEEVERLTGYRVRVVDVTVSALLPETRPRVE
ncbi:putative alkaline shock family protein YloU [Crossiella equi]|uniref:Alkaline shock family protein YloU n=1 Tax=Crossiella equi TaxID=130796 RepID=A0ABS5AA17_9PSEU|nr:Asp23/Gls24 family envelope stress response protein [Crossiella equi]MBP2473430.1 putative alkaline shock family protein YloU [Crossiella equi]